MNLLNSIEKIEKGEHRGISLINDGRGWRSKTPSKVRIRKYRRVGKREKNKKFFRKMKKKYPTMSNRKIWRKIYGSIRTRKNKK